MAEPLTPTASAAPPPPYLAGLNDAQRRAVEAVDGPVLVLAGAGTGKTRVLTTRFAHILATRRAWPSQILAVTFTNKAAREMRERLERIIGQSAEGLWLGTFHSVAARLLRRHAEVVGLKPNFTILDTDDQLRLVKQIALAEGIDEKRWPPRALLSAFERWKDRGLTPDKVPADDRSELADGRAAALFRLYQERLATLNAADFGDLLLHNLTIFISRADILADYQHRFRYILVDEYQDTNVAQYLWLRLLAQGHRNLCCVGDDDQSIYSWRGAEIGNILRFERDFPGAQIVRLEQNYRSTPHILAAASALIAQNEGRLGKTLWTVLNEGDRIALRGLWDGEEEARWVGDEIEARQRQGEPLAGDRHPGARRLPDARVRGALHHARPALSRHRRPALLRAAGNPRRDRLSPPRPPTGRRSRLRAHRQHAAPRHRRRDAAGAARAGRSQQMPLTEAARRLIETDELKPAARKALRDFLAGVARWRGLAETALHTELAAVVLDESGYTAMWQADKSPEAPGRLENLKEFVAAMAEFDNLAGFLDHVSLVMENTASASGDMVSLMTLHSAKGLEFDTVFLPGWEEGLFPNQRAMDDTGRAGLEEERRLAYVGLTRARRRAYVSYAANRRLYGQWQPTLPSRFIAELPTEHLEVVADPGLFPRAGALGGADWSPGAFAPRADLPRLGPLGRRPPLIEGRAGPPAGRELRRIGGFAAGDRVFHQKFGYGTVRAVEDNKLAIRFEKAGDKMVMDAFVEKA